MLDKTLHGTEVIFMISKLKINEFLQTSLMENFVSSFWYGPYERNGLPSNYFTSH